MIATQRNPGGSYRSIGAPCVQSTRSESPPHCGAHASVMFDFGRSRRQAYRALVDSDARDLIARFGEQAAPEALKRHVESDRGEIIDGNRPVGHWIRVRRAIIRLKDMPQMPDN
jgi:hypothetical protein